jgi:hypothetical protein
MPDPCRAPCLGPERSVPTPRLMIVILAATGIVIAAVVAIG